MQVGMIGLGRMGMGMARRLLKGGHAVTGYNRTKERVEELIKEGAEGAFSIEELVSRIPGPGVIWMMLPAGEVIDRHIDVLLPLLEEGDIVVDGGNTYYKDDIRRAGRLKERGVSFLDAGVSGGIWGLQEGYSLMTGGDEDAFKAVEPILKTLAPPDGYLYCGGTGAGHYVKMVHNGIEYALMQAYAEGFEVLKNSPYAGEIDAGKVAHLWNRGSVIRSWLLELLEDILTKDPGLSGIRGYVEDSGEGRWIVKEAVDLAIPAETISLSLFRRFRSRQEGPFSERILAALRAEFGGHRTGKIEQ